MTQPPRMRLVELGVKNFGIIDSVSIVFGDGMTALTGETGAGKTLVIGAIDLLLGGRADPGSVRTGETEAVVEGRFQGTDGEELVLTRIVAAEGRSRAYVNGGMVTAASMAHTAGSLVELNGQHAHQTLLSTKAQRDALDRYAEVDLGPFDAARARRRDLEAALEAMGGDEGTRAREADLLRFQMDELDRAAITGPDEDDDLDAEEDRLAGAVDHRLVANRVTQLLTEDGGASDSLGESIASLEGHHPFADFSSRLRSVQAELADVAAAIRNTGESIEDDPERLATIRERRQLLVDLRRKYGTAPLADGRVGSGTLADVVGYHRHLAKQLEEIEDHDARAQRLEAELTAARTVEAREAAAVGAARRRAARPLADAVADHFGELAMPEARLNVAVGDEDPGDSVNLLLAANPGSAPAPLSKVASGGELARTMLALRLVLSSSPGVLIFDEVDAGIGGGAALAVGRALAALGRDHQVLVVTHLPQVAAFADHQVRVRKETDGVSTTTAVTRLDEEGRVGELSRMLSGTPESDQVRLAARELLATAHGERGR